MEIIIGIFAAFGAVFAVGVVIGPGARLRRTLRQARRVPISDLAHGQIAKVTGIVEPKGDLLSGPLSGRQCSSFSLRVEEQKTDKGGKLEWVTVLTLARSSEFWIRDKTGRALIDPADSECSIVMDRSSHSASARILELIADHPDFDENWHSNRTLRYEEGVVEEGERVSVLGTVSVIGGMGGQPQSHRVVISKSDKGAIIISDAPSVHDSGK